MTAIALPDHLQRFPCMQPWIGSRYRDPRHKRLLVVGESHYLPNESTIHQDPDHWYRSSQHDLSDKEIAWASTVGNITGQWYRAHTIYRAIQDETARILRESGVTPDAFPLNHVAYCNYFLRPAPVAGGSMEGNVAGRDAEVAEQVLRWFVRCHRPELLIFTSRFAGRCAESAVRDTASRTSARPIPAAAGGTRCPEATATAEAATCSPTSSGTTTGPRCNGRIHRCVSSGERGHSRRQVRPVCRFVRWSVPFRPTSNS